MALAALWAPTPRAQTAIDFTKARDEAVRILQDLVRIDTSNPPGNETKAAEYIKATFEREKIPSEIVALEPARGNVIARIKGNGRRQPLLLMGHTDVVGVERAKWSVDPFAGVVKDGYVWGRGARDDKGMVAALMEVMLLLRRTNVTLDRDVIFLGEVIPAEAEATLDVRALPDEKFDDVVAWMRRLIDDPAVEVVPPDPGSRPSGAPSRLDSEMYKALEAVQQRMFPAATMLPMMLTAATDSAQLRARGVQAYGLSTPGAAAERPLMHGNDERVPVAGVGMFVEYLYRVVVEVAGAR